MIEGVSISDQMIISQLSFIDIHFDEFYWWWDQD